MLSGSQVRLVRCHHHHLTWLEAQGCDCAEVNLRIGLVVLEILRGQEAVKRQARETDERLLL